MTIPKSQWPCLKHVIFSCKIYWYFDLIYFNFLFFTLFLITLCTVYFNVCFMCIYVKNAVYIHLTPVLLLREELRLYPMKSRFWHIPPTWNYSPKAREYAWFLIALWSWSPTLSSFSWMRNNHWVHAQFEVFRRWTCCRRHQFVRGEPIRNPDVNLSMINFH